MLINTWETKLPDLHSDRKKVHVYSEMAELLTEQGFEVTGADIKAKMESFKRKYIAELKKVEESEVSTQTWIHFKKMSAILRESASFSSATIELPIDNNNSEESLDACLKKDDPIKITFEESKVDILLPDGTEKIEIEILEPENVCRACLTTLAGTVAHYLFDAAQLANKFADCSTLTKPTVNDNLPKMICTDCHENLLEFSNFQKMCLASNEYLRKLNQEKELRSPENASYDNDEPVYDFEVINTSELQKLIEVNSTKQAEKNINNNSMQHRDSTFGLTNERDFETDFQNDPLNEENRLINIYDPILIPNNKQEEDCESVIQNCTLDQKDQPNTSENKEMFNPIPCNPVLYQCELCLKNFKVKHCFVAHQRVHQGLVPYPCPHEGCESGFMSYQFLKRHLDKHQGKKKPFICDQIGCDKSYYRKNLYVEHMKISHNIGPELSSHICEICGKVFKKHSLLTLHRYRHRDISESPYICKVPNCQKRFLDNSNLREHMLRHAGIKKYMCPICGVRKTASNELKTHINYHTREHTWLCRYCSKVFYSSSHRTVHERTVHERVMNYKCSYCELAFTRKKTLKYHEMIHTGEKPYKCEECGKCFRQPVVYKTHCKIHQKQKAKEMSETAEPIDFEELEELND